MAELTSEEVTDIFSEVYDEHGDLEVELSIGGVRRFRTSMLEQHRSRIRELLLDLPDLFMKSKGGGWSFLNACDNKDGNQWTGLHMVMGQLFGMGEALGLVESLLPKEMWSALPGGMPYYVVDDT